MRHLYLQIYVAFIVILMVFLFLMSMAWWLLRDRDDRIALDGLALLVSEVVPTQTASPGEIGPAAARGDPAGGATSTLEKRQWLSW